MNSNKVVRNNSRMKRYVKYVLLFSLLLIILLSITYCLKKIYEHQIAEEAMKNLMQGRQDISLTEIVIYQNSLELARIKDPDSLNTITNLLQSVDPELPPYNAATYDVEFHFGGIGVYKTISCFHSDLWSLSLPGQKPMEPGWPSHTIPIPNELQHRYHEIFESVLTLRYTYTK